MFLNENNIVCDILGMHLIINIENGAVVGVDDEGLEQYQQLSEGAAKIEMDQSLHQFLEENEFISENPFAEDGTGILTAYVHVTNKCNLHCLGCYSDNEARNTEEDLSKESIENILSELGEAGVKNIVISGGEPLFRKDIVELVEHAKVRCGIDKISLITNGTVGDSRIYINLAKYIDTMAVSLDTFSSECKAYLRDEGIFDQIMFHIKLMKEAGLNVSILPTLHHKNVRQMSEYMELAKALETEISFSIFTTKEDEKYEEYMLSESDLRYIAENFSDCSIEDVPINNTLEGKKHCGTGCNMISVGADGSVYPCHMLMEETFKMGNLTKKTMLEILEENKRQKNCWETNVEEIDECKECEFKFLCGGGCRARAYLVTGCVGAPDPFCSMYKDFYTKTFSTMIKQIRGE